MIPLIIVWRAGSTSVPVDPKDRLIEGFGRDLEEVKAFLELPRAKAQSLQGMVAEAEERGFAIDSESHQAAQLPNGAVKYVR